MVDPDTAREGLEKRRLLRELAGQASRDGHIPFLVESDDDGTQPHRPHVQVALAILPQRPHGPREARAPGSRASSELIEPSSIPPAGTASSRNSVDDRLRSPHACGAIKNSWATSALQDGATSLSETTPRTTWLSFATPRRLGLLATRDDRRASYCSGGVESSSEAAIQGLLAMVDGAGLGASPGSRRPVVVTFVKSVENATPW